MRLSHISLFSGIGGIDLAANWAGFETILFCEIDKYCQKVLRKHWPDVPIIEDVKDVTKETVAHAQGNRQRPQLGQCTSQSLQENGADESESSNRARRDRNPDTAITLLTGGFPCQPVSVAGKRRGKEDDRWLWPEMLRVIQEVRPSWVVAENVAGLTGMVEFDSVLEVDSQHYTEEEMAARPTSVGEVRERWGRGVLDEVMEDLEKAGYEVQTYLAPACAVNAPHRRDRVFVVGYSQRRRIQARVKQPSKTLEDRRYNAIRPSKDVADTKNPDWGRADRENDTRGRNQETRGCRISRLGAEYWAVEPNVGRVASRILSRVDRLRGLGNAVVPQQIYPILRAIADIESVTDKEG